MIWGDASVGHKTRFDFQENAYGRLSRLVDGCHLLHLLMRRMSCLTFIKIAVVYDRSGQMVTELETLDSKHRG